MLFGSKKNTQGNIYKNRYSVDSEVGHQLIKETTD